MKRIPLLLILMFTVMICNAQRSYWSFNYHMSFGVADQAEFIEKASFRGWGIEGRGFINQNLSFGGATSWEVFNQIYRDLDPTPVSTGITNVDGHVSGVQYRYINTIPILVNSHYYLGKKYEVRPYFGLSLGTAFTDHRTEIGLTAIEAQGWGFVVQPEVGASIPFGLSGAGLNVSGRFRYTTRAGDTTFANSFFTLAVGLGFMN